MVASEVMAATETTPIDVPTSVGAAVDVVVAWTFTAWPDAVRVEPVTKASVVPLMVIWESAPAPATPMLADTAATTLLAVILGLEVAVISMLPPSAVTWAPSVWADTFSPTVLLASMTPVATPTTPPARVAATVVAEIVGVSLAVTLTAPDASTPEALWMKAAIVLVIVFVELAPAPLAAAPGPMATAAAAAAHVVVIDAVSSASIFRSPAADLTLVEASETDASTSLAMVLVAWAVPIAMEPAPTKPAENATATDSAFTP